MMSNNNIEDIEQIRQLKAATQKGWNTWFNNSVLTHVLLPDGIGISIGFKFYNTCQVLKEALIGREEIHPGPRSYDGSYTELNLKCSGHEMLIQSASLNDEQYILVTPIVNGMRPPAMFIEKVLLWNKPAPEKTIETFVSVGNKGYIESRQLNLGLTNPYLCVELSEPVAVSTDKMHSADEVKKIMAEQKEKVLADIPPTQQNAQRFAFIPQGGRSNWNQSSSSNLSPPLAGGAGGGVHMAVTPLQAECYNAMRCCNAWNTIYEPERGQVCSPVSRLWNINWGGYVLFDWDTYFSALIASLENKELAYTNLIAITGEITENGFIPNFGAADGNKSRDRSEPPVGSIVVQEIYRRYKEKWIVEYLFPNLLRWNRWWEAHRSIENGCLTWGSDPYKPQNGAHWEMNSVNDRQGASYESGLDNSPMYDNVPFDEATHKLRLADVGLTSLYIADCQSLASLAREIGKPAEAAELEARGEKAKKGLETLWDEEYGFYCNVALEPPTQPPPQGGRSHWDQSSSYNLSPPLAGGAGGGVGWGVPGGVHFSHCLSATNFYALFSDAVSVDKIKRIINEHFYNKEEFYGEYIIPMTNRNDPAYKDQDYWRGRIWAPTNFLAWLAMRHAAERHADNAEIKGLLDKACKDIAEKSSNLLMKEWREKGHVHENYNTDTGEGCDVHNSDRFYHWGGLLAYIFLETKHSV
jgi:hypothetical protein